MYLLYLNQNTLLLDSCLQVDPTNNDVMNDVLSEKKSMDSPLFIFGRSYFVTALVG